MELKSWLKPKKKEFVGFRCNEELLQQLEAEKGDLSLSELIREKLKK